MGHLQANDERALRVRDVMKAARLNLIGHIPPADRAAAVLAEARSTVARLDPKAKLQREVAAMRQRRVERTLNAARRTLERLARQDEPSHQSIDFVTKAADNTRIAPTWPSSKPLRETEPPPTTDGLDDLRRRLAILSDISPSAVVDEFERELGLMQREIEVLRREYAATSA
jgi:hypothetical protein